MQKIKFVTLDGQERLLKLNTEFIQSTRQHTAGEDRPTAYVASVSHVLGQAVDTDELCIAVVLPGVASDAIDHSATSVTPQVRTRPDGTPVGCALLANGRVAVHAEALNKAQPLSTGRLSILWMLEDKVAFAHYTYDDEAEEWFWTASMVADGHRHETNYGADGEVDLSAEPEVIEAIDFWIVETTA